MANRYYLQNLIKTDEFYGGNNTVEQTIRLYEHDLRQTCCGKYDIVVDENPKEYVNEDYLEAWDAWCEGRC